MMIIELRRSVGFATESQFSSNPSKVRRSFYIFDKSKQAKLLSSHPAIKVISENKSQKPISLSIMIRFDFI
jgi:hypothetical protein